MRTEAKNRTVSSSSRKTSTLSSGLLHPYLGNALNHLLLLVQRQTPKRQARSTACSPVFESPIFDSSSKKRCSPKALRSLETRNIIGLALIMAATAAALCKLPAVASSHEEGPERAQGWGSKRAPSIADTSRRNLDKNRKNDCFT